MITKCKKIYIVNRLIFVNDKTQFSMDRYSMNDLKDYKKLSDFKSSGHYDWHGMN